MCSAKLLNSTSYIINGIKQKYFNAVNNARNIYDVTQRKFDSFKSNSQSSFFVKHSEVRLEDFFMISSRMMHYCGYDLRCLSDCVNDKERKELILKNIWFWLLPLNVESIAFLILLEAWQSHDMGKLTLAISTVISVSVYAFNISALQRNKVEIVNFLEELEQNFPTRSQLARDACFFIQKLSVVFIILWVFLNLIIWLVPLASILFFNNYILFVPVPDSMLHGLIYPFAYLWISLAELFISSQTFGVALVIVTWITLVCFEFDQLAHYIAALRHLDQTEVKELMPGLIEKHIRANNLTEKLNGWFAVIFLARFVVSIFAIAVDFFAILSLNEMNVIALGFALILCELNQLFLICCVGQMLINANDRIATAVYNCGWENWTNLSLKKSILMIFQKSQEPVTLTIWKFGSVSLELFTSFVNSMYDFTSFLLAIYEN